MIVDHIEQYVYLACDNLNVYQYPTSSSASADGSMAAKQKKTLTHKKRVTAMCLSVDGRHLVTGDSQGLIYIWTL
jgi:WD40 repeat protein